MSRDDAGASAQNAVGHGMRSRRHRALRLCRRASVTAVFLVCGCRQVLSTGDYQVGADARTECDAARPVEPPAEVDVPGSKEYTFVVRHIDVGDGTVGEPNLTPGQIGYDIDGVCSTADTPGRCKQGHNAVLDGPGGRDNALGALIANIPHFVANFPIDVKVMNDQVELGRTPPQGLFRIREYGGDRNDDQVAVDWLLPGPVPGGEGVTPSPPSWTAEDHWPVLPDTFTPSEVTSCEANSGLAPAELQRRTSVSAYVTDQQLVARFPDGMTVRFWIFEAPLVDAVLTADLVYNLRSQRLEMQHGIISGRAPGSSLLREIPKIQQLLHTTAQCRSHPLYPLTKLFICSAADWSCASGPDVQCDWFSVGIAFETAPASVGDTVPEPEVVSDCVGDDDPGTDTCAK